MVKHNNNVGHLCVSTMIKESWVRFRHKVDVTRLFQWCGQIGKSQTHNMNKAAFSRVARLRLFYIQVSESAGTL